MSIVVNNLSLSIANKQICSNLNIEFSAGEFWAILGVNGVGKSTLLRQLINCETSHNIQIDDQPLNEYRLHRKLLAQKTGLLLQEYEYNFPCSVLEAALIGRHPHMTNWQWETENDLKIANNSLQQTELDELKERNLNTLSGGEKRRLNIATLLTQDPDYFLLDEPTNHLDLKSQIKILRLLKNKFTRENKTGVMVIHDANLAYQYCDKTLLLFGDGQWAAGDTKDMITTTNLNRIYDCTFQIINHDNTSFFMPDHA